MDALGQKLINEMLELKKTNTPGYLGVYAILRLSNDKTEPPEGYSRGDFKRSIKLLRTFQHTDLQANAQIAERAIALIRRDWLHREVQYERS